MNIENQINPRLKSIKKALNFFKAFRGDEWARTTDSRIFSPMLYQLSYITPFLSDAKVDNCSISPNHF